MTRTPLEGARRNVGALCCITVVACSEMATLPTPRDARADANGNADGDAGALVDSAIATDTGVPTPDVPSVVDAGCVPMTLPAAMGITVAEPFSALYRAYDIGRVPGLPATRYGGCLIDRDDPNLMYIGVDSETPMGSIYAIRVVRDCGRHIIGYSGTARLVASAPYVDANLFYDRDGNILYSMWPVNQIAILRPGSMMPSQVINLMPFGVEQQASPGGLAFVPTGFVGAGELRAVGWPNFGWFRIPYGYRDRTYTLMNAERRAMFTNGTGGFAYVPAGSPMIDRPALIMAEWATSVSLFDVDMRGDVQLATRRPFLTGLTNAWGAYFEPVTGDFMFPSWGNDRVIVVRGFATPQPPPIPPPG
jgi:hypothetical protein